MADYDCYYRLGVKKVLIHMLAASLQSPATVRETEPRPSPAPQRASERETVRAADAAERTGQTPTAESNRNSRSRLAYDSELSRVFVEIVDPKSGEVVHRFPPEQIVRHMAAITDAPSPTEQSANIGLVFDEVV